MFKTTEITFSYCAFDIFQKVVFCFVIYTEEVNLQTFVMISLRKHAYSNIWKISPPKTENFQIKSSDIFHISAQNIDCGYSLKPPRRGGSNEYPQSMFYAVIRKIMYTPVNPSFTDKSGVQGGQNYIGMFRDECKTICRNYLCT